MELEVLLERMCHKAVGAGGYGSGLEIMNLEDVVLEGNVAEAAGEEEEECCAGDVSVSTTCQDSLMDISIGDIFKYPICSIFLNEYGKSHL